MTPARDLRPTDVVALAAFEARATTNQARTRDALQREGKGPMVLKTLVEPWLPTESRRSVVAADGLAIRGLGSARPRRRSSAWEVDWLLADDTLARKEATIALLEQIVARCAEAGALRVFVRVLRDSGAAEAARHAGFWPYMSETLFRREAVGATAVAVVPTGLRPRAKQDDLALFRLYSVAVPSAVRSAEGMTLEEWEAGQEALPGRRHDFVLGRDDNLDACVWVARSGSGSQIGLIATHDDEATVNGLVGYALSQCGPNRPVTALVPDFQTGFQFALREDWSFEEVAHYQMLIRRLPVRVAQPAFVPARA